jgi:FixJ family two-component response regulator
MVDGSVISSKLGQVRSSIPPVVSVIASDALVRRSLHALIEGAEWRAQVYSSAVEYLRQPRVLSHNCLLLDAQHTDISGLEVQSRLSDRPETAIVFLCSHDDIATAVRAMKAGAIEVLPKPLCRDALLSAMRNGLAFSATILLRESELGTLRDRFALLSPREREVMELVLQGYLNKQVGHELGISEITVKAHRGKVMHKMMARSLAHLVRMSMSLTPIWYGSGATAGR